MSKKLCIIKTTDDSEIVYPLKSVCNVILEKHWESWNLYRWHNHHINKALSLFLSHANRSQAFLYFSLSHVFLLHKPPCSLHISPTRSICLCLSVFLISSSIFYSPFLSNPFFSSSSFSTPSPSFFLISWGTVCEWAVNCLPSQFKPNSHGSWADYLPSQQGKGA